MLQRAFWPTINVTLPRDGCSVDEAYQMLLAAVAEKACAGLVIELKEPSSGPDDGPDPGSSSTSSDEEARDRYEEMAGF
jgi:hypothetical protein